MARMLLQLSLAMVLLPLACNGGIGGNGDGGSGGDGTVALPGCPDRCGNVSIPFPFGTKPGCYWDDDYLINCTTTKSSPEPTAFLGQPDGNIMVTNISLKGELQIQKLIAKDCYGPNGEQGPLDSFDPTITLSTFTVSTRNKFTAIGCDTYAILVGVEGGKRFLTGCMSLCDKEEDVNYGTCNGAGCCQITSFPSGLRDVTVYLSSYYNHSYVREFNPCSYAFIVEDGKFNFSKTSFQETNKTETLPMILDWSIGNESCSEARNRHNNTCNENSMCIDSTTRSGYLCQCLPGYQGNPYLPNGCKDIDECMDSNRCINGTCNNLPGSYNCSCKVGYEPANGTVCTKVDSRGQGSSHFNHNYIALISIGSGFGAVLLLLGSWGLFKLVKKRRKIQRKKKFFKRNGGLLLEQQLSSGEANVEKTKLFNSKELERAADRFNVDRVLGQGGQGTVYKGMLTDGKIVAIKKSKIDDEGKIIEFINEVVILSQINHRNVVKLLGCCLETEVPLLVYEFVPNGTLSQYIYDEQEEFPLTWEIRLRIATEVAGALSYLHTSASFPIYHRDIKSSNILLDGKYRAKVADFGTSRSIAIEQTHLTTLVYGTVGYLDPEYFQSSQFTDKSDVYSFGVVLVELLTGQQPISIRRPEQGRSLATYFMQSMDENNLYDIVDARVMKEGKKEAIMAFAELAKRCLNLNRKKRPTMKEVVALLEYIRNSEKASGAHEPDAEEVEYVREVPDQPWELFSTSTCPADFGDPAGSSYVELPLFSNKTQ